METSFDGNENCVTFLSTLTLTVAIEVLTSLLYDLFRWPHVYIPVLPLGLLGVMHTDAILIGCHSSVLHIAEVPHDAVIVSLDSNDRSTDS